MSNQINDGGPAFPISPTSVTMEPNPNGVGMLATHHGMKSGVTIRDYFAAAALQGLMASIQPNQIWSCEDVAVTCHRMADAMIKAREAKP